MSGCSYLITRAFEGYPLLRLRHWPILGLIPRAAVAAQRHRFRQLRAVRDDVRKPQGALAQAQVQPAFWAPRSASRIAPTARAGGLQSRHRALGSHTTGRLTRRIRREPQKSCESQRTLTCFSRCSRRSSRGRSATSRRARRPHRVNWVLSLCIYAHTEVGLVHSMPHRGFRDTARRCGFRVGRSGGQCSDD